MSSGCIFRSVIRNARTWNEGAVNASERDMHSSAISNGAALGSARTHRTPATTRRGRARRPAGNAGPGGENS
jgi:hypothetical protein